MSSRTVFQSQDDILSSHDQPSLSRANSEACTVSDCEANEKSLQSDARYQDLSLSLVYINTWFQKILGELW